MSRYTRRQYNSRVKQPKQQPKSNVFSKIATGGKVGIDTLSFVNKTNEKELVNSGLLDYRFNFLDTGDAALHGEGSGQMVDMNLFIRKPVDSGNNVLAKFWNNSTSSPWERIKVNPEAMERFKYNSPSLNTELVGKDGVRAFLKEDRGLSDDAIAQILGDTKVDSNVASNKPFQKLFDYLETQKKDSFKPPSAKENDVYKYLSPKDKLNMVKSNESLNKNVSNNFRIIDSGELYPETPIGNPLTLSTNNLNKFQEIQAGKSVDTEGPLVNQYGEEIAPYNEGLEKYYSGTPQDINQRMLEVPEFAEYMEKRYKMIPDGDGYRYTGQTPLQEKVDAARWLESKGMVIPEEQRDLLNKYGSEGPIPQIDIDADNEKLYGWEDKYTSTTQDTDYFTVYDTPQYEGQKAGFIKDGQKFYNYTEPPNTSTELTPLEEMAKQGTEFIKDNYEAINVVDARGDVISSSEKMEEVFNSGNQVAEESVNKIQELTGDTSSLTSKATEKGVEEVGKYSSQLLADYSAEELAEMGVEALSTGAKEVGKVAGTALGLATGGMQIAKGVEEERPEEVIHGALHAASPFLAAAGPAGWAVIGVNTVWDLLDG